MSYEKISGTAKTIAFVRSKTTVPYATELAQLISAQEATQQFYRRPDFEVDLNRMIKLADWAKLRLLSLVEAIKISGIKNIVEIGSGFSPVGLMLSEDPTISYIETDLPEIVSEKSDAVRKIVGDTRGNLIFGSPDIFDTLEFEQCVEGLGWNGPVAVIHEGLFPYFTHAEKLIVAKNIAKILSRYGGVWITSDISLRNNFERSSSRNDYNRRLREVLTEATGRDMTALAFNDFDEAEKLFGEAGFNVERHSQLDFVPTLFSEALIAESDNLKHQQLWIMRP